MRTARKTPRRLGALVLHPRRRLWGMETVPRGRVLVEATPPPDANTLAGATSAGHPRKIRADNGTLQGHRHEGGGNGA